MIFSAPKTQIMKMGEVVAHGLGVPVAREQSSMRISGGSIQMSDRERAVSRGLLHQSNNRCATHRLPLISQCPPFALSPADLLSPNTVENGARLHQSPASLLS